jgi:hypothetical protein
MAIGTSDLIVLIIGIIVGAVFTIIGSATIIFINYRLVFTRFKTPQKQKGGYN